jgi:hypothetical protein
MAKPPLKGEIEARIERIAALIAGARRLIGESRPLDLSVLAFAVADLRDAVRAAPAAATEGLAPRVVALQTALDALGEDLDKAKPAPSPETRRAAIRAYDGGRKD